MNKLFILIFSFVMLLSFTSCKKGPKIPVVYPVSTDGASALAEQVVVPKVQGNYDEAEALVLAVDQFDGVFSPFFGTSGVDIEIAELVHARLIGFDRSAQPDNTGLADYVTPEEVKSEDGKVEKTIYTFKLKEGLVFSDGTPLTADDVLFNYLILCDPNYSGSLTIYTTPIIGVNEYRADDKDYAAKLKKIQADSTIYEPTPEEIEAKAGSLAKAYGTNGVTKEDWLPGGKYYEDETLSSIRSEKCAADEIAYISANLSDGAIDVPEIEGIKKIDNLTIEVTITGVDPKAIYNLGAISVAPKSYYGEGFVKGDLSLVQAKDGTPMGAGAYRLVSYENNVVILEANDFYYKGEPKIKKIKYQVLDTSNKVEGVELGEFYISDPKASTDIVEEIETLTNIHFELIDNLGYGYIGISAERITDVYVRKGIMHLMDRTSAVESYYGNLASIIERPLSTVSWAYPKDATEVYGFDPSKALEFFLAAGYIQEGGKLMKDGRQLTIDVCIPAGGTAEHPSYPIVLGIKTEGEKLGMAVNIVDYAEGNKFLNDLDAGLLDVWCSAWGATPDPDLYQTYHSEGPSNYYGISDVELDQLIMDARSISDMEARKVMYARALTIIMEYAVEMPIYQRKNMFIFNKDMINVDTLPKDMTPYYLYFAEVEKLELMSK